MKGDEALKIQQLERDREYWLERISLLSDEGKSEFLRYLEQLLEREAK